MRNDDYYMELNESIVLMDKRTEGPGDARFHFHEDYEIFLFLEGDVDLYIEQSVHHMQRGHLAVFNDREIHRACHYGKIPFHRIAIHFHPRLVHGMCTPATNLLGCFQNHRPGKDNVILLSEEQTETLLCMNEKLRQASQSEKYGSDVLMTRLSGRAAGIRQFPLPGF